MLSSSLAGPLAPRSTSGRWNVRCSTSRKASRGTLAEELATTTTKGLLGSAVAGVGSDPALTGAAPTLGTGDGIGASPEAADSAAPGSDTGAVEMAMWTMLGARPVEMLAWESFGEGWVTDAVKQLKLDAAVKKAPYGQIVDLATVDFDADVVFTWNGTTSGVRVPNGDAIPVKRQGLTICDATSAACPTRPIGMHCV